mgnify:CR=1
ADVLSVEEIGNICSKAHHEFRSVKFLEQYLEDAIQEIPCPTAFAPSLEGKCVSCRKTTCIKAHGMRCEFCDAMFCQKCKNEKLIPISPPLHFPAGLTPMRTRRTVVRVVVVIMILTRESVRCVMFRIVHVQEDQDEEGRFGVLGFECEMHHLLTHMTDEEKNL